ncbi:kinase-like domain-containing protein [Gigaspora rosea]|uniref:Kinase-like domain-containing protein n=1 Tax=Gigaspora rosea TaxID=44941 RepID=A0A397VZY0_9GLOM|nr:kinase-like domain-containing protein [Gigaspora rosea]
MQVDSDSLSEKFSNSENEDELSETSQSSQDSSFEYGKELENLQFSSINVNSHPEGNQKEKTKRSEFECYNFNDLEIIGEGGYCHVKKAYWKSRSKMVALKNLKPKMISNKGVCEEFIKEANLLAITCHPNIIKFYGVAKDHDTTSHFLILQYANESNLRDYLKRNFNKLKWDRKLNMSLDIAKGLKYLHTDKAIVHRDLHSKNILVHNGLLKIADFGMSTFAGSKLKTTGNGIPAYVDPQYLKDHNYERNEKSDIYSFGVLLWEISSGYPPFQHLPGEVEVIYRIFEGKREIPVKGTPEMYIKLYSCCWDETPGIRPDINEIYEELQRMSVLYKRNQDIQTKKA